MTELSLDLVKSQLKPQQRLLVDEGTVAEIQKLAEDPDYGPEFVDMYIDHLNVLKEQTGRSHDQYVNAIKFFSLVEANNSLTDAYIKTFPERYEARKHNHPDSEGGAKDFMRGEASRFNKSMLVTEIRRVGAIPVQLIYRHILHEAIISQADLMRNAKSEMVRQKAGAALITELKPTDDQVLKIEVDDGARSAIEELRDATERLAAAEYQSVQAGVPLQKIAESNIYVVAPEEDGPVDG